MKTTLTTLKKYCPEIDAGFNDKNPVFYVHGEPGKIEETPAHEIVRLDHTGWYTDIDQTALCIGHVFTLPARPGFPYGVFLAGYYCSDNWERVLYPDVYHEREECARAADRYAERFAEIEREHSEKWHEARNLEDKIEELEKRACELFIMRHRIDYARSEMSEVFGKIRDKREELKKEYAQYL
jgi:hypothetical protein